MKDMSTSDDGKVINEPHFLIPEDDPALLPQFKRIIKGLYYYKYKTPLKSDIDLEFKDSSFKFLDSSSVEFFKPNWKNIMPGVFRYFVTTSTDSDTDGIIGMIFYETLYVLAFFGNIQS